MFNERVMCSSARMGYSKTTRERTWYSKHICPFPLHFNSVQRNCCHTLVHWPVVCQGCRWRAQGRRREGTTEISVVLLSHRIKGKVKQFLLVLTIFLWSKFKTEAPTTCVELTAGLDRGFHFSYIWGWIGSVFLFVFSFFLSVLKPSSECTHTA